MNRSSEFSVRGTLGRLGSSALVAGLLVLTAEARQGAQARAASAPAPGGPAQGPAPTPGPSIEVRIGAEVTPVVIAAGDLPANAVIVVEILGQSNAWGTSSFIHEANAPHLESVTQYARIWNKIRLSTSHTPVDDGEWVPLTVGFGRSGPQSIGPEMQLAYRLWEAYQRPVRIIKCCRGETPLASVPWAVDWNSTSQGEVFTLWREYYHRPALAELAAEVGPENVYFAGLCWFQGASDGEVSYAPASLVYEANLIQLIDAFRAETGPGIPLSIGRSENYNGVPQYAYIEAVRVAQRTVAESTSTSAWYSTDLTYLSTGEVMFPFGPDQHHFNGKAQVDLGHAMAFSLTSQGVLWKPAPKALVTLQGQYGGN